MSIIKRLSTTLFSHIDQVVGGIENHDALAEAAIIEQRKKIAAARVQLERVQSNEQRLRKQVEQLMKEAARWESRAIQAAAEDESRAIACIQRRNHITEQVGRLQATRDEYTSTATRMGSDICRAERELGVLSQKHTLLRARQASNAALGTTARIGTPNLDELETTFDHWEQRIAQEEILNGSSEPLDALEQHYRSEEESAALRAELEALMAREKEDDR